MLVADSFKGHDVEFDVKNVGKGRFKVFVTTFDAENKPIPDALTFVVDVNRKTVYHQNKVVAFFGELDKEEKNGRRSQSASPPRRRLSERTASSVAKRGKVSRTSVVATVAGNVIKCGGFVINWFLWVVQKSVSIVYYEVIDIGPLTIPVWALLFCFVPFSFPFVESATLMFVSVGLNLGRTINAFMSGPFVLTCLKYAVGQSNLDFLKALFTGTRWVELVTKIQGMGWIPQNAAQFLINRKLYSGNYDIFLK